jgi:outer membrane lipoprotein SlyB
MRIPWAVPQAPRNPPGNRRQGMTGGIEMNTGARITPLSVTMVVLVAAWVAGCAGNPHPIVDTKAVDMTQYQTNLDECSKFGEEVNVAGGVARGALLGAAVGAVFGALAGDFGTEATVGGVVGGTGSGLENEAKRQSVIKECMRGRGYRVLN